MIALSGCGARAGLEIAAVRVDHATQTALALQRLPDTPPPAFSSSIRTPLGAFPLDLTALAPPPLGTVSNTLPPNAQPPPFGLNSARATSTPDVRRFTSEPPPSVIPPMTGVPPIPAAVSTLMPTPIALRALPPLDRCSIVNRTDTPIDVYSAPRADAPPTNAIPSGGSAFVRERTPENWFSVSLEDNTGNSPTAAAIEGYVAGGSGYELYGDCLGIAVPGDRYDAPAALAPELFLDCRFVPLYENALIEIGNMRAPLDSEENGIMREYPILRANARGYLIIIADGIAGWVLRGIGTTRGDCARLQLAREPTAAAA